MPRKPIEIPKKKLVDLYVKKNMSITETAEKLGRGYSTVVRELSRHNISLKKQGSGNTLDIPEKTIIDLYVNKKLPYESVAKKLGISKATLARRLHKLKITPRRGPKRTQRLESKNPAQKIIQRLAVPHNQIRLYQLFSK